MQISYHPDGGGMTRTRGNVTFNRRWGTGGGGGGGGGAAGSNAIDLGIAQLEAQAAVDAARAAAGGVAEAGRAQGAGTALSGIGQGWGQGIAGLAGGAGAGYAGLGNSLSGGIGSLAGAYGVLGGSMANAAGAHSGALAGLGGAMANNYGNYSGSLAAMANAQANERMAAYGAMAQSEAARQMAAGNIANQALSSYGALGNAAMAAWSANQQAYNQALANMQTANQSAVSQYGQSRNQALAGLGESTSSLGRGLGAADAISNIDLGGGGGGFSATSPTGSVASGSYGGTRGSVSGRASEATADRSFAGLDSLRGDVMDDSVLAALAAGRDDGANRLDSQHYTSRNEPFNQFRGSLGDFRQLAGDGYGQLSGGMNQFYGNLNANRADFSPMVNNAAAGYYSSANDLRNVGKRMSGDFRSSLNQAGSMAGGLRELGLDLSSGIGNLGDQLGQQLGQFSQKLTGLGSLMSRFPGSATIPGGRGDGVLGDLASKLDLFKTPLQRAQERAEAWDFNLARRKQGLG